MFSQHSDQISVISFYQFYFPQTYCIDTVIVSQTMWNHAKNQWKDLNDQLRCFLWKLKRELLKKFPGWNHVKEHVLSFPKMCNMGSKVVIGCQSWVKIQQKKLWEGGVKKLRYGHNNDFSGPPRNHVSYILIPWQAQKLIIVTVS